MLEVFTKTTFILAFHKGNALEFKKKKKKKQIEYSSHVWKFHERRTHKLEWHLCTGRASLTMTTILLFREC